jgi:hypothetical protein
LNDCSSLSVIIDWQIDTYSDSLDGLMGTQLFDNKFDLNCTYTVNSQTPISSKFNVSGQKDLSWYDNYQFEETFKKTLYFSFDVSQLFAKTFSTVYTLWDAFDIQLSENNTFSLIPDLSRLVNVSSMYEPSLGWIFDNFNVSNGVTPKIQNQGCTSIEEIV